MIHTRENETIKPYVNERRQLNAACEFGDLNDSLIKVQIILEILDKTSKDRLLKI